MILTRRFAITVQISSTKSSSLRATIAACRAFDGGGRIQNSYILWRSPTGPILRNGQAAIVLTVLLAFGMALGAVSLDFHNGILRLTVNDDSGTLVVKVMTGLAGQESPIANASVIVSTRGEAGPLLQTNSDGEVKLQLLVGNYTLIVYNDQFSVSGSASIQNKATTTASVYVKRYLVAPLLTELDDPDDTGYVSIWQHVTVAVNSSSADLLLASTAVFLDTAYTLGTANGTTVATTSSSPTGVLPPATSDTRAILYSEPINSSATGLWWFSWEPTAPLALAGLSAVTLSTYSASMQVQTSEP